MTSREMEVSAGISTRWCLLRLKWCWGLPLCETVAALLSSYDRSERHARAVSHLNYLACWGWPHPVRVVFLPLPLIHSKPHAGACLAPYIFASDTHPLWTPNTRSLACEQIISTSYLPPLVYLKFFAIYNLFQRYTNSSRSFFTLR